ncbi:MAG TPA: heparinase II/III family protein [Planktothrix sp.]
MAGLAVILLGSFCAPKVSSEETDKTGAIQPLASMLEPEKSAAEKKAETEKVLREKLRQLTTGNDPGLNEDLLANLQHEHPRLLITDKRIVTVRDLIKTDARAKEYFSTLTAKAEGMLKEPTPERHMVGSDALLEESRRVSKRVTTLAGLYRLTHDKRYLERARQDMLAVAAFPDWSPKHFLDVAEMTAAVGIGYDWLYADLSAEDRKTIEQAIAHLGLDAGLDEYAKSAWWTRADENWNLVCNGGLTVGALAVGDVEHDKANRMLHFVKASVPIAMQSFAPDGGWSEGPGYWNYATKYCMFMMASMQTALKTDFGFSKFSGFDQTGFFNIYCYGPIDKCFNFADCADDLRKAPQMFWMSTVFDKPVYAGAELNAASKLTDIFHLLFYPAKFETQEEAKLPLMKAFEGTNVCTMRTSWTDPDATFVGIKGGDNASPHAHLDLGSFVIDSQGCRWALDLGPDDYDLPGYFGKTRWNYYRLRTEGHNTLTIGRENQDPKSKANLFAPPVTTGWPQIGVALTEAYGGASVIREIFIGPNDTIYLSDSFNAVDQEWTWHFHTPAQISLSGDRCRAALNMASNLGKPEKLFLLIKSSSNLHFTIEPATAPAPQAQQEKVSDLTIHVPARNNSVQLLVLLSKQPIDSNVPVQLNLYNSVAPLHLLHLHGAYKHVKQNGSP